jgi:penicillin-binding protein 2
MVHDNSANVLINSRLEKLVFRRRLYIAIFFVLVCFLFAYIRLYQLTVVQYSNLFNSSQQNQLRLLPIDPSRGLIRDRNGMILARNDPYWSLTYTPELIEDEELVFSWLLENNILDQDDLEIFKDQASRSQIFIELPIAVLSEDQTASFAVDRHNLPGLDLSENLFRYYPYGPLTAHVVGYLGAISPDDASRLDLTNYIPNTRIGKSGLELNQENILHGNLGRTALVVNSRGRVIREAISRGYEEKIDLNSLYNVSAIQGGTLELTLDIKLQELAYSMFEDFRGAVIAMKPKTGEILVLASNPAFDPNLFSRGISQEDFNSLLYDQSKPLFNRAISGTYPPGSTIKPFLGLAALELGMINAETTHFCSGSFLLPGGTHEYRDWLDTGHGSTDISRAIAQSCDVFYYQLSTQLGIDNISSFLKPFGFGDSQDFGMGKPQIGILPSAEWKQTYFRNRSDQTWFDGETVITGIGQGYFLSTPLQIAIAVSILANKGTYVPPRLINGVTDADGDFHLAPSEKGYQLSFNQENIQTIFDAMNMVTHSNTGTAYSVFRDDINQVAGKTGTAQVISIAQGEDYDEDNLREALRDHGLFFGFAPMSDPEIVVVVIVENSGGASRLAAPIVKSIIDTYFLDASLVETNSLVVSNAQ